MNDVSHVTTKDFTQEVLRSPVPVLVDFFADWCGPCRMLAPTLERLATEFAGRVRIVKVNIDDEPALASQFQVSSIPTLIIVVEGKVAARTSGLLPENQLRQVLSQLAGETDPQSRRVG